MKKITTKAELKEKINHLHTIEVEARKSYEKDLMIFADLEITDVISKIKIDEDRHIKMLSEILEILEK